MARAGPVVAVSAGRAVPVAEQQGHGRLGQEEHPDGGRDDEGEHGAPPPVASGPGRRPLAGGPPFGQVGRHHRHDGDGHDAVGHLQEGVGVGVRGDRVGARGRAGQEGDDEHRDLVGHHEAEGPSAEADDRAQRGVVQVPVPPQALRLAARRLGISATPWSTTPSEVPRPSRTSWPGWSATLARLACRPAHSPNQTRTTDADHVVDDGRPGHGHEAAAGVEQGGGQGEEAVGGDLDHEPAQQRGGDGPLGHDLVDLVGVGGRIERGQRGDE
jgi:hypothetical protein